MKKCRLGMIYRTFHISLTPPEPNKSYLPMTVSNQTADIEIDNFVFNLSVYVVCLLNLVLARAYTYTALYLILFLQTVGAYFCTRFQLLYQAGEIYFLH